MFLYEDRREVFPSQLDEFAKITDIRKPSKNALEQIAKMPEADVKDHFAEIVGQPFVSNDWGGESHRFVCSRTGR